MNLNNWLRFSADVKYDLLVPPFGSDYYSMTPKQVKENYEWFVSKIPERTRYLSNRIAEDLKIPISELNFSPDSLKTVWKWFLKTARVEKVSKEQVSEMEAQWGHLGEHWIQREQLTVATQFILRDIGMYLGETFIATSKSIHWGYFMKPKNEVSAKRPVLLGFFYVGPENGYQPFGMPFDPVGVLDGEAYKIISKTKKETDLYDLFIARQKYIRD